MLPSHAVRQMQNREHNPHTEGLAEASQVHHAQREMAQALSTGRENSSL